MNRIVPTLFALVLVVAAPLLRAQALPTQTIDGIVAVVEEDVILRSELDRAVSNIRNRFVDRPEQLPPPEVLEKQVLERLIAQRLQLQRAAAAGVRISDAELEQTISRIVQQQNVSLDQLRAQLARDGVTYEEFRSQLRDELTVNRMQQTFVQSRVAVSDTEIDILLARDSEAGSEVRLGYLLVALPDGATPEQIDAARTKIEGVRGLIERGEMDFSAAAIRYSDHQTALEGGDMGWRAIDEIPPLFANILPTMQPGEVSQPLRGPSGYSLVRLIEKRDDSAPQTVTEYHARGIMVRITELLDADKAKAKIDAARARIVGGEDFAVVAREVSDDTISRNQGGDMGWFQVNAWGTAVANQMMALSDGEVSEPFQSEVGWHIVERIGTREQDVTVEARRNKARETIAKRKADEEYDRFLRQLRAEAYIDNRLAPPAPLPSAPATPTG
ncbi:peptidylprolyl isomerase [Chiayiivirga flava]|uniref:Chaperone SurA n=1 Tax=Chiayiivirga flava TaxID=659595 RepID=A0A7W8D3K0_9GAMM|nr:peptidylprolyl isomerase [Chiayiivirga flava]MBB5207274.1 peptidyl-prolyl cis-trans isomerase SurA [Chiayiivirga flava]